ncbi:hypothetical protein HRbin30_03315 [bacterium HR30]|nr:hypothetical protein HRbin30_03315 [bacterium HR30]
MTARRLLLGIVSPAAVCLAVATLAQVVSIDPLTASPGDEPVLTVRFAGEGAGGVALQFEIALSEVFAIRPLPGDRPQCGLYPSVERSGTTFAFVPSDCAPNIPGSCSAVRALIFDFFDRTPLPDGPLVQCTLSVSVRAAEGLYPVGVERVAVSDASGTLLPNARGVAGVLEVRLDLPTPTPTPEPSPTATPSPDRDLSCVGDCNRDRTVTIEEVIAMVVSALGEAPVTCAGADPNRDGQVTIDEIVAAVSFALHGCESDLAAQARSGGHKASGQEHDGTFRGSAFEGTVGLGGIAQGEALANVDSHPVRQHDLE